MYAPGALMGRRSTAAAPATRPVPAPSIGAADNAGDADATNVAERDAILDRGSGSTPDPPAIVSAAAAHRPAMRQPNTLARPAGNAIALV